LNVSQSKLENREIKTLSIKLDLTEHAAAVLLRCLSYGENAISKQEHENGIGTVILYNVKKIRTSLSTQLASKIISEASEKGTYDE